MPPSAARTASAALAERRVKTVARRLDDVAVVGVDRVAQDLVVARQSRLHRVRVLLPQARRPLEVREEERDRAFGRRPLVCIGGGHGAGVYGAASAAQVPCGAASRHPRR